MDHVVHLTRVSTNAKTGPIPVSTTSDDTCPPTCPFIDGDCYAQQYPMRFHWDKVSGGLRGSDWSTFCDQIRRLPHGLLWRHNQAGDLPGDGLTINAEALEQLVQANRGKYGFTYTHYPVTGSSEIEAANREAIRAANERGFRVNLSANNLQHADHLASLGIGPVATVLPETTTENTHTPAGRKVVVCPATQRNDVTCQSCQLCQTQRSAIVGFPAHGVKKRNVSEVARAA